MKEARRMRLVTQTLEVPQSGTEAAAQVATRTDIKESAEGLKRLRGVLQVPGLGPMGLFAGALSYLEGSPFFADAETCYQAAGGDMRVDWTTTAEAPIGGKTWGALFLSFIYQRHLNPQRIAVPVLPDFLRESRFGHQFSGKAPRPLFPLDERARYGVQHFDRLGDFEAAFDHVIKRGALVERADVSDDLAGFIAGRAQTHIERAHFDWL